MHVIGASKCARLDVPFGTLTSLRCIVSERRAGAATRLVSGFEQRAARRAIGAVRASPSLDDVVAATFYCGFGWRVARERAWERGVTFE